MKYSNVVLTAPYIYTSGLSYAIARFGKSSSVDGGMFIRRINGNERICAYEQTNKEQKIITYVVVMVEKAAKELTQTARTKKG